MLGRLALSLPVLLFATVAMAHPHHAHLDDYGSFMSGLLHPIFGLDHILAMVAVGLWASLIGRRAIVVVPAAFVGVMAVGFLLALGGVELPFVEPVILASVVVLGLVVALALPVPVAAGAALVGFFALFHGHAHGEEMGLATMAAYGTGFVLSTAALHAAGIALGLGLGRILEDGQGRMVTQAAGALTVVGGILLAIPG
ncbi:MAG: HupE/UreJ family protein [Rhizobiaceae bacterium]